MLKNNLKNKKITIGSWITIGDPTVGEIMSRSGYDWLVVDLEHSSISIDQASNLIRIIELCGVTPLVRLTSNDKNLIKRVLDAGAHGIVVPMVNTAEEAKNAVAATRYAPKGNRGVGLARAQGYGAKFEEYLKWQKNEVVVIVMIEHVDALNNLEAILSVEGVDGYLIGPYDLSCSLGIPGDFENSLFKNAIEHIKNIGVKLGSTSGIHIVEPIPAKLKSAISGGFKFIAYGVDIRFLDLAAKIDPSIYSRPA